MAQPKQVSFFPDASNLRIRDSVFNAIIQGYSGIEALSKNIASAAIHNSAARQDPPRCHPLTRKDLLGDIMSWIKNPARKKSVVWLNGSAGAGKSAILQTLAENCEAQGLLAASFFFVRETAATSTNSMNISTGERFFATIAYQLAVAIDELQEHVDIAVRVDPSIATKAMERQMEKLILGPMDALLKLHRLDELRLPPVIIIDGLDECIDEKQQKNILRLLLDASAGRSNVFPFCIVISSRAGFAIDSLFSSSKFQRVTRTIALDGMHDAKAAQQDIRAYLRAEFDRIRSSDPIYKGRLGSPKAPWPSDYIINLLASKSSGQFVYASTVIDFVSNPDCSPDDQLRIMLVLLTGRSSPMPTPASSSYGPSIHGSSSSSIADTEALGPLDNLYRDILGKCSNRKRTLSVLGHVLAMMQAADAYCATWGAPLNTGVILHVIDHFLRLNPGDSERAMRRLQPLISLARLNELKNGPAVAGQMSVSVMPSTPGQNIRKRSVDEQIASLAGSAIRFSHASFSDFLQKPARAGPFSIKLPEVHAEITSACLGVMSGFKCGSATRDEYLVWVYAVLFWSHHCAEAKGRQERAEILHRLSQFDVSVSWMLPQTLPALGVNEMRLREALGIFGIKELKDCPGQCRWSFGDPDLQSMAKEIKSVATWLQHPSDDDCAETINRYNSAFTASFLHHLNQSPNKDATLFVLGILRSGEVSERMLLDIPLTSSEDLVDILQSTKVFLYRYAEASPLTGLSASRTQHYRIGLKSEAFTRFLDSKHLSRRILNSGVYQGITLSLLRLAEDAITKMWDPIEYSQAWTYSLSHTKNTTNEIINQLYFATMAYSSSSYLQRGLRRYHAKRVLSWINMKRPTSKRLAAIAVQWSSPPIWKSHWQLDMYHSVEPFPSPTLYELSVVSPSDSS